jgi:hypothetical protein
MATFKPAGIPNKGGSRRLVTVHCADGDTVICITNASGDVMQSMTLDSIGTDQLRENLNGALGMELAT